VFEQTEIYNAEKKVSKIFELGKYALQTRMLHVATCHVRKHTSSTTQNEMLDENLMGISYMV